MSDIIENDKSFQHFSKLPQELRMMVIDEMEDEERMSFSFTSKWCHRDAVASKNYVYSLELYAFGMENLRIHVVYGKYETREEKKYGYSLDFEEVERGKYVKCESLTKESLWNKKLEDSISIFQYATDYFKKLLKPRHHSIRKLVICGRLFNNFDFGLKSLKNIEELYIEGNADIRQFFANIPHPLKRLGDLKNMPFITECEALYQVRDRLDLHRLKITSEQFRRLSASNVRMCIGDLRERDILNFIQSWQNGTVQSERGKYEWLLDNHDFNIDGLCNLLELQQELPRFRPNNNYHHHIGHNHDARKIASLRGKTGTFLTFTWDIKIAE